MFKIYLEKRLLNRFLHYLYAYKLLISTRICGASNYIYRGLQATQIKLQIYIHQIVVIRKIIVQKPTEATI